MPVSDHPGREPRRLNPNQYQSVQNVKEKMAAQHEERSWEGVARRLSKDLDRYNWLIRRVEELRGA